YDGTIFHRNIKGFMIQGGDPTGTGKGGTSIRGKKLNDEIRESLKYNARGILSMANSGPNTNGSQFFISYAKQPHLNGLYTVFGRVIHGLEVLDLMEKTPTAAGDRPLAEIRLNRFSWTGMISAYARHGDHVSVMSLYKEMEPEGSSPDSITFLSVLVASCRKGLLGRVGRLDEAEVLMHQIPGGPGLLVLQSCFRSICVVGKLVC
ncbi:peptidyl-prolyl cis-trans isomerase-like 3-like, partial [Trifolium medium]|nr:peptidyl-prolyl cis-trans isomerase-like 3-like [Trifolium medium]